MKKSPERYDQESIPSEISEDMWGEIPKLQAYQNAQILKKEKEDRQQKRDLVRNTLDQQVKVQKQVKQQRLKQLKQMDQEILSKAK